MSDERIRTTISVRPEVLEVFQKMARSTGASVSRSIGDWLESTAEGAEFVSAKMQQIRHSPAAVMHEFHAHAHKAVGEIDVLYSEFEREIAGAASPAAPRGRRGVRGASAPSSNTGLKSPAKTVRTGK